jgi:hypothetical protein
MVQNEKQRFTPICPCVDCAQLRRERRHGSTRVPDHAWRSLWRMVVYIYYITAAGNFISWQLSSSCQGNRYDSEKAGGTAVHHIQNHTCRVTLLQQAKQAAVLCQPSSLRPHWQRLCQIYNWRLDLCTHRSSMLSEHQDNVYAGDRTHILQSRG